MISSSENEIDVLAEIRDELKELPFIRESLDEQNQQLEKIERSLERIADQVQLGVEFYRGAPQKVEPGFQQPEPSQPVTRLELDARKALYVVRAILDSQGELVPSGRERLFEIEELLSRALGNPIWEGRRT